MRKECGRRELTTCGRSAKGESLGVRKECLPVLLFFPFLLQTPRSAVTPVIDVIDSQTFQYKPVLELVRGGECTAVHRWE